MVKDSKTGTRPLKPGQMPPRPAPGSVELAQAKANRLTLRMHPDIMEILSWRAAERGVSRSHLVEQILVGFMRSDPRNPRMDPVGRIIPDAETPLALRERSPVQLADKWRKFATAHEIVMGVPPSADWLDDTRSYWDGVAHADRGGPIDEEEAPEIPAGYIRRRRNMPD